MLQRIAAANSGSFLVVPLLVMLGLPGDVRTDKDLPWIEVPRN